MEKKDNKMAYKAKDPHTPPPTALSVPKRNKKLEVGRRIRRRRRRKSQSEDPYYHKGMGKKSTAPPPGTMGKKSTWRPITVEF